MTKEELQAIEEWAEVPIGNKKLALALDITEEELRVALESPESPLGRAVKRGRLKTEAEHLRAVVKLSNQGSGPAQAMLYAILKNMDT